MTGKLAGLLKGLKKKILPQEGRVKGFAKLRGKPSVEMLAKKYFNAD